MVNSYSNDDFQGIALEVNNGSVAAVTGFKQQSGINYPICLNASTTAQTYGVSHDYSMVIDHEGIIRYKSSGFNRSLLEPVIDNLIAATAVENDDSNIPDRVHLHHNYPNPFNPSTTLEYEIPEQLDVSLIIYDISGQEIQTLVTRSQAPGSYQVSWNGLGPEGHQVNTGMYFARLQAGSQSSVVKMVYLR